MTSYLSIIIFFVCLIGVIFLIIFLGNNRLQRKGGSKYSNLIKILDARWRIPISNTPGMISLCFIGKFMGRKIICKYSETIGLPGFLEIRSRPRIIPKKLPWYKFKYSHSVVYKNYALYGDVVTIMVHDQNLSNERCNEILTDLNHACEMVESGNYQLS